MKYIVVKNFLDRFDNMKLNKIGDEHKPPNDKRAKQLIELGFIEAVETKQSPTEEKKRNKKGEVNEPKQAE